MSRKSLLVWGTANPVAMPDDYMGVYVNSNDMRDFLEQIDECKKKGEKIPVMLEHVGDAVGSIVSAWVHNGTLQCCLEIEGKTLESAIGQEMVKNGVIKDLSLGYCLEVQQSKEGRRSAKKFLKEVSLVKVGARKNCHILATSHSH